MGLDAGDESSDAQLSDAPEEKILVSVRLRPLNEREVACNDALDWECINSTTILFKNNPTAYSFDRVFGGESSTKQVYEEAAKGVALSVMNGVNSSIFAYGQTSSGKTYTMTGITEHTMSDIFDYINKNPAREFVLKFSAMEIYNEAVRDLLSGDSTPLRLLDDPERGTVVEKLTEVTLRNWSHLEELLSVCEAERSIGETSMNELSSRSHQILRLTVDSSARECKSYQNASTLSATVHFVDLAGSERASQTLSAGTRLKEGGHINRSLLALGTVIRKLSKGRNGHVPYRDSKLTRILQNSLGGNARTAIICTMSPAHSHVEQSRNTLLFASCAKQVSTNAQVNVVMSEKALVKQLQKELARLENQLKNITSLSASSDSLKEKELLIEKMDREIRELIQQRDQAHSRLQDLMQSGSECHVQRGSWDEVSRFSGSRLKSSSFEEYAASEVSEIIDPSRLDMSNSSVSHFSDRNEVLNFTNHEDLSPEPSEEQFLTDDTSPRMLMEKYLGPDPTKDWEKIAQRTDPSSEENCKEVQCIDFETEVSMRNLKPDLVSSPEMGDRDLGNVEIVNNDKKFELKAKEVQEYHVEKNMDHHADSQSIEQPAVSLETGMSNSSSFDENCKDIKMTSPISPRAQTQIVEEEEKTLSSELEKDFLTVEESNDKKLPEVEPDASLEKSIEKESTDEKTIKVTVQDETPKKMEKVSDNALEKVPEKMEKVSDNALEKVPKKMENDSDNALEKEHDSQAAPPDWSVEFERQRIEIIQLWQDCNIPLVHRSSFFLLFKGDRSDSIYMEVELRRLSFLRTSRGSQQSSSTRAIDRERHKLSKLMLKKLSSKQRTALFEKWGIGLKTKQRRLQLSRLLWRDTKDMEHIKESAELVAILVGLNKGQALEEMVGLSFTINQC